MEISLTGASLNSDQQQGIPTSTAGGRRRRVGADSDKPTSNMSATGEWVNPPNMSSSSSSSTASVSSDASEDVVSGLTNPLDTHLAKSPLAHNHNHSKPHQGANAAAHSHQHSHSHSHSHSHGSQCEKHGSKSGSGGPTVMINVSQMKQAIEQLIATGDLTQIYTQLGASVKVGIYQGFEMICEAWKEKNPSGLPSLLGKYDNDGHTLTHWAAKRVDDIRFLQYLCNTPGVDTNLPSIESVGMRPLHWAATVGSIPMSALLLKTMRTKMEKAAGEAAASGDKDVIPTVPTPGSQHSAGINVRDKAGCTPLLIAAQYGHADLAAFLIRQGADLEAVDNSRDTALHWAAYKGSVAVCGLLLYLAGAVRGHLDVADAYGQTPIHLASLRGNVEVVEYLLDEAESFEAAVDEATATQFPLSLVRLQDRDGKTPLDLALKKKRTVVELLLREYTDKYMASGSWTWTLWSNSMRRSLRQMFSLQSWLMWMGFVEPSSQTAGSAGSPKLPWYFVVAVMSLATSFYPLVFLPLDSSKGQLWDLMGLHAFSITSLIVLWTNFILVYRTDPGTVGGPTTTTTSSTSSRRRKNGGGGGGGGGDAIATRMRELTERMRAQYNEVLDSYANPNANQRSSMQLCHTCHIARPLRSKHCRLKRRCVLLFDHHCPFVGTTIGLYNYKYFYLFLLSLLTTEIGFIVTLIYYVVRSPTFPLLTTAVGIFVSLFIIPAITMSVYHTQLTCLNLTTNEHMNLPRYSYLHKRGRFHNPFHFGPLRNCLMRMSPGPDSYVVESEETESLVRNVV